MSRPLRYHQEHYDETSYTNCTGRSPLRRAPINQLNPSKSPIRSRTPTRAVSPLKHHVLPTNIRYISNISPLREHPSEVENHPDLSNGKSIKYIQGSKVDRNYETNRKNDFNKPSDRTFPEENRLFGKMVEKLNSEKKGVPSSQNSHKTSLFADTESKSRVDPSLRPSGTFKQLISLAKVGQTRSDIKPRSRGREDPLQIQAEEENLSCLVYRVKNLKAEQAIEEKPTAQIINHCSPVVRRKPSKPQNIVRESIESYRDLDILLEKIEGGRGKVAGVGMEELFVRGSVDVRESLSMNPFL